MCIMCMLHGMVHDENMGGMVPSNASREPSLLEILGRRYALGEISREQLEEMKRVLGVTEGGSLRLEKEEQEK